MYLKFGEKKSLQKLENEEKICNLQKFAHK